MTATPAYRKKLIEVALPLEAINVASAREKSIRHGHPSTLHLWWARRPLAACRAVLFASIVDDPSSLPDLFPDEDRQEAERQRLFRIIEELVRWESSTNETVLHAARTEIARSVARAAGVELPARLSPAQVREALAQYAPPVLDPFCGGCSIPLEAQRLGLEAHGSDLNPVAVLITKALIEIPPAFAGQAPLSEGRGTRDGGRGQGRARQSSLASPSHPSSLIPHPWPGASGLAADVRHYGQWMRDEAFRRIGHLYPKVRLPKEQGGGEATVIAWLWARTVTCPNPACGARMPLVRSFALSTKKGKQAWVEPVVDRAAKTVRFAVKPGSGVPQDPPKIGRGATFKCLVCDQIARDDHIKAEGMAKRMGAQLMAVVAEGQRGRVYVSPPQEHEEVARVPRPENGPVGQLATDPRNIWCVNYGLTEFADLFTPRQLVALTTFSDLVGEARERVRQDALAAGRPDGDSASQVEISASASRYADAIAVYLACAVDRLAESSCTLARWQSTGDFVAGAYARQALPMIWDYAEVNPFSNSTRNFYDAVGWVAESIEWLPALPHGSARQVDAAQSMAVTVSPMISTDPPYYDNIGYADLSDFFYVWLRPMLGSVYPDLFRTLLTPKDDELIAAPYRHEGGREGANAFFEEGLGASFSQMARAQHYNYPLTVFYAFKQAENEGDTQGNGNGGIASTGWETMLQGMIAAGFSIGGTWPMRTERTARSNSIGTNALASSIVLVCRPRPEDAPVTTRQGFVRELRGELPGALRMLQHGNIAPVDLAQASIGPGMAVFSKYARVLEPSGEPMRVRTALQLINQTLDEVLSEQEGEFDPDTRWAIAWYEQHGTGEGAYGTAETLSTAKNTSVGGLAGAGIVLSRAGKVRLLGRDELSGDWDPQHDRRLPVWEVTQRLILALERDGEEGAAAIARQVGGLGEVARDLAYRLYTTSERKKWAQEALAYNSLVVAWPAIVERMREINVPEQARLV